MFHNKTKELYGKREVDIRIESSLKHAGWETFLLRSRSEIICLWCVTGLWIQSRSASVFTSP